MLTERQRWAYLFVARGIRETGRAPRLGEIARHIGCRSRGNAHALVEAIIERGYLRRDPHLRTLALVERPPIRVERTLYFRFDDETKELMPWTP